MKIQNKINRARCIGLKITFFLIITSFYLLLFPVRTYASCDGFDFSRLIDSYSYENTSFTSNPIIHTVNFSANGAGYVWIYTYLDDVLIDTTEQDMTIGTCGSYRFRLTINPTPNVNHTIQLKYKVQSMGRAGLSMGYYYTNFTHNKTTFVVAPVCTPSWTPASLASDICQGQTVTQTNQCDSTTISINGTKTCDNSCPTSTATWSVGGVSCSKSYSTSIPNNSIRLLQSDNGHPGSVSLMCVNGVVTQLGPVCNASCTEVPASGYTCATAAANSNIFEGLSSSQTVGNIVYTQYTCPGLYAYNYISGCSAPAPPVNGACGTLPAMATTIPTMSCAAGKPVGAWDGDWADYMDITRTSQPYWYWNCMGINGGDPAPSSCAVPQAYTVTASAGSGGSISPSTGIIKHGLTTTFTVTPSAGYSTNSVSGCGGTLNGTTYTTGAITADCAVTASFTAVATPAASYTLNLSEGGGGIGEAGSDPFCCNVDLDGNGSTCSCSYAAGTSVSITGSPDRRSVFTGFSGDCSGTDPLYGCQIIMNSNKNVTVNFNQPSPINGTCGSSNGTTVALAPTTNLCTTGSATTVTGGVTGPWGWSCVGSGSGVTKSCSASTSRICSGYAAGGEQCGTNCNGDWVCTPIPGGGECNAWCDDGVQNGDEECIDGAGSCAAIRGCAPTPVNGKCGSSNGAIFTNKPIANLCEIGTASVVSGTGTGPWAWSCSGSGGGLPATCSASYTPPAGPVVNFDGSPLNLPVGGGQVTLTWSTIGAKTCSGTSTNNSFGWSLVASQNINRQPNNTLYTPVDSDTTFSLDCVNSSGVHTVRTVAVTVATPTPVDGKCGSSNGAALSVKPTSNLCEIGTASVVSGIGPWTWSCGGSGGGLPASCSATKAVPIVSGSCGTATGATFGDPGPTSGFCGGTSSKTRGPEVTTTTIGGGEGGACYGGHSHCEGSSYDICEQDAEDCGCYWEGGSGGTITNTGWYWECTKDTTVSCTANYQAACISTGCPAYCGYVGGGSDNCGNSCAATAGCPINASCGTANRTIDSGETAWRSYDDTACEKGTGTRPAFPDAGTSKAWTCSGINGGTNASCNAYRTQYPGECGGANGIPTDTPPTSGFCTATGGTPSFVTTNAFTYTWTCTGSTTANCSAPRIGQDCTRPCGGATISGSWGSACYQASSVSCGATCPSSAGFCLNGRWSETSPYLTGYNDATCSAQSCPTCGTSSRDFTSAESSWGSDTECGIGTGTRPAFPTEGSALTQWTCSSGGSDLTCTARVDNKCASKTCKDSGLTCNSFLSADAPGAKTDGECVAPTNLTKTRVVEANGDISMQLNWDAMSGATYYYVRINDTTADVWTPSSPYDIEANRVLTNSYNSKDSGKKIIPGHKYDVWVQSGSDAWTGTNTGTNYSPATFLYNIQFTNDCANNTCSDATCNNGIIPNAPGIWPPIWGPDTKIADTATPCNNSTCGKTIVSQTYFCQNQIVNVNVCGSSVPQVRLCSTVYPSDTKTCDPCPRKLLRWQEVSD